MFYRYEIRNNGREDILYLYLNMQEEFSKELGRSNDNKDLSRRTKNFIRNNNINFTGNKVFLIVDGIIVKTLDISNVPDIREVKSNKDFLDTNYLVNIKYEDNSFIEVSLKEYLLGILSGFFFFKIEKECFKALAILFRTYAYKMMEENNYIEANSYFGSYVPIDNYKLIWDKDYEKNYKYIEEAINETLLCFVTYKKDFILPFIHYCNNGFTYVNKDYPYLKEVNSLWDLSCPNYIESKIFNYEELGRLLGISFDNDIKFDILEMENKKFISKVKINDKTFTGNELIKLLNLKSLEITFIFGNKSLKIITKGWGNFLGLSIYGANELAKNNCDYISILHYYFPEVKIMQYSKNF